MGYSTNFVNFNLRILPPRITADGFSPRLLTQLIPDSHRSNPHHQKIISVVKSLSRYLIVLAPLLLFAVSLSAQYLNENGEVLKDKIIEELKQYPDGSADQWSLKDSIVKDLFAEISMYSVLKEKSEVKSEAMLTLHHLSAGLRDFKILRSSNGPSWEDLRKLDTISAEALAIESQIQSLNDSLYLLYDQLIDITQRGEEETRATKEKAAMMIGKSPFYDHIEYIFKNESSLNFGLLVDERGEFDDDCWGCQRSGLVGLTSWLPPSESKLYRWRVMPFLIEHFGRPDSFIGTYFPWEFATFVNLSHEYEGRHLLLEFMRANAKDPDNPLYEHLIQYFGEE